MLPNRGFPQYHFQWITRNTSDDCLSSSIVDIRYVVISLRFDNLRCPDATVTGVIERIPSAIHTIEDNFLKVPFNIFWYIIVDNFTRIIKKKYLNYENHDT